MVMTSNEKNTHTLDDSMQTYYTFDVFSFSISFTLVSSQIYAN